MKYRHILFDIDGTLLDSEKTGVVSLQKTIRVLLGREEPLEKLYPYFGIPTPEAIAMIDFVDKEEATQTWETYFQEMRSFIQPFEGVDELLSELSAREDCKMGVITSRGHFEINEDPQFMDRVHHFDTIIGAEDSEKHKPNPDPLFAYMERTGAKPEECIYIGDTIYDSKCAEGAGVDFALINWTTRDNSHIPAKYYAKNCDDLRTIIEL